MDLFSRLEKPVSTAEHPTKPDPSAPLAERLRPQSLDEFIGQEHLLGEGKLLRRALESKQLPSLILWGPPGTGKTTLARILASAVSAHFASLSAVTAGVKEVRAAIAEAEWQRSHGARTVLFLDEIHRFNKAQQDALLPHVEHGTVVLIGATTENPSFEVNAALLSRCRVVQLSALTPPQIGQLLGRAMTDSQRGLGASKLDLTDEARDFLAEHSGGDGRRALGVLEVAVSHANRRDSEGRLLIDQKCIEEALQRKVLLYDKSGDEHYNVVSAFIKSLRGSDPDAAVYWMARMLEAGEDPLFVLRRMVIFAAEDIGVADPRALQVAVAATEAVRFVGLPEGTLPMSEAAIYLALAPKSNSAIATYQAAKQAVEQHGALPVPLHLRNAPTKLMREMGYGKDYQYPHSFAGNHVAEHYLPDALRGSQLYEPSQNGLERALGERLHYLRSQAGGPGPEPDKKTGKPPQNPDSMRGHVHGKR